MIRVRERAKSLTEVSNFTSFAVELSWKWFIELFKKKCCLGNGEFTELRRSDKGQGKRDFFKVREKSGNFSQIKEILNSSSESVKS